MSRCILFCSLLAATLTTFVRAAPVPLHLMRKEPVFSYPDQKGTTWVYDANGKDRTLVIARSEAKGESKIVTTEWVEADGSRTAHMVLEVSEKGVFLLEEQGQKYDAPWCILKLPHREGQQWEANSKQQGCGSVGTMTSGPIQKLKLPAGEFNSLRVDWEMDSTNPGRTASHWYANGIGLVQLNGVMKLKSFTPGKE